MPLPEGGKQPWPPKHCARVNEQLATWQAWYSGDVEQLQAVYGGDQVGTGSEFFASESGGFKRNVAKVVDRVRRWFWGQRNLSGQPRQRLHVPIAGDIAAASADLLFSEPPQVTVDPPQQPAPTADGQTATPAANPTQDRLDELLDDGTHATLLEAAELAAAHGGVFLRVVWDVSLRSRPWISAVHADTAVPEFRQGRLTAVTFWRVVKEQGSFRWRHLERHEPGKIMHALYQGDQEELGVPVPLTESPETAGLATVVNEQGEIPTGHNGLTAVYVPNMKPGRWRHPATAPLGRSDFAAVEPLMDALDLAWSSWMRDVDLGKSRLVVPHTYMESHGPGKGATMELDRELYEPVNTMDPGETGKLTIEQIQFKIRVEEHSRTVRELKTEIVSTAGYSAATFGLDSEGSAQTATEVASRNRRSLITRARKIRYWRPALAEILEALLAVDKAIFSTTGVVPQRPHIDFAPAVAADPEAEARTLRELDTAGAISTDGKVRRLHPDWGDDEVAAEVERIRADRGSSVPDPDAFTGAPPPAE